MIPTEAVEAAAQAYRDKQHVLGYPKWEDLPEDGRDWRREFMRAALEAAAPHIRARALDDAKDALNPGGSYVLQNIAKWLSGRAATERTTL